jgi:type I restriction enzyme S subunit
MTYFAHSHELPDWAAQVPESWDSNWLKWSVDLSTKRATEQEQEALPYISNEDIASWTGKLLVEEPKPADADSRRFRQDDVLFNKLRPYLAKVYHADFDGVSSGELLCLRPSEVVEPRFLFYVLASKGFIETVNAETFGAKMPRADWEIVGHQPLPLPPLDTQRRIAGFLDEKTARIDALIEKKRALLDRLAEKRQALITRAVTKGLNPDVTMRPSGIEWLGDIPRHWDCCGLGQKIKLQRGVDITKDERVDGPFPVISSGGIDYFHDTAICNGPGVLVGRKGSAGKLHYVENNYWPHDTTLYVREFRGNVPKFVWYMLHILDLTSFDTGSSNPTVNRNRVHPMCTAWPNPSEQEHIVSELDAELAEIGKLRSGVVKSLQYLEEYRAASITSTVTGQVGELNGI